MLLLQTNLDSFNWHLWRGPEPWLAGILVPEAFCSREFADSHSVLQAKILYLTWTTPPAQFPSMPRNILKNLQFTLMCSPRACFEALWNFHPDKQAEKNEPWKNQTNIYLTVNENHHGDTAEGWCSSLSLSFLNSGHFLWTMPFLHNEAIKGRNTRSFLWPATSLNRASVTFPEITSALGFFIPASAQVPNAP